MRTASAATVATPPVPWALSVEMRERYDPAGAAEMAQQWLLRAVEDAAEGRPVDEIVRRRMHLVLASAQARRGEVEPAARSMREVIAWAVEHEVDLLEARSNRLLGALFRRVGDPALSLEHSVAAVDLLTPDDELWLHADHRVGLADALGTCHSFEDSLRRYHEAYDLAVESGDLRLRLIVLNNLAYTEHEAGLAEDAVRSAERFISLTSANGIALRIGDVDTIARAYMGVDRLQDAGDMMRTAVLALRDGDDYDARAEGLLTLAEIDRGLGHLEQAQAGLDECQRLCEARQLNEIAVRLLREQAELHGDRGRFEEAFAVFKTYHEQAVALHAVEREARARTLQAIFEASEARRDSERFREMSLSDPLTQLRNRRFVDDHLTSLLQEHLEGGRPLSVAFVDLDRFKAVNDTFSHEVGDEVLRRVARELDAVAASVPSGFAARMGGEEFLIVLPGVDKAYAAEVLERTRLAIAGRRWDDVTAGMPVTASIGGATAPEDGTDRLTLLGRADGHLYAAKGAGRNRVVQTA